MIRPESVYAYHSQLNLQHNGRITFIIRFTFFKDKCRILEAGFGLWHSVHYKESHTILFFIVILLFNVSIGKMYIK